MPKINGEVVMYTPWEKLAGSMAGLIVTVCLGVSAWSLNLQLENKDEATQNRAERVAIINRLDALETWGPKSTDRVIRFSDLGDMKNTLNEISAEVSSILESATRTDERTKAIQTRVDRIETQVDKSSRPGPE